MAAAQDGSAVDRVGVSAATLRNGGAALPFGRTRHSRMRKLGVADGTKGSVEAAVGDELDEAGGVADGTGSTSERPDGSRKGSKRRDTSDADTDEELDARHEPLSGAGGGGSRGSACGGRNGDLLMYLCATVLGSTWWTLTTLPNALVLDSRNRNFAPF